ncbi:MAG: molybdenum cofactor guanylyltransferase [Hyphobacterium sp.]|nr:MAG: molybdenum cofactor guanylyltransferase [Hyphobacterium sp.]
MTSAVSPPQIAGIVLAGGESRRMGTDKAGIEYLGQTFLERAQALLRDVGCDPVRVSGRPGLACGIEDSQPGQGPAQAVLDSMRVIPKACAGALFIPVDMPLLTADDLEPLLAGQHASAWRDHPLPVFIPATSLLPSREGVRSVKYLLSCLDMHWFDLPQNRHPRFRNFNTEADLRTLE